MKNGRALKKVGRVLLIVCAALVVGALLLGVLNGLVADGKWSFGWQDYRYDETGYTVGEGTVAAPSVTSLSIDWVDGTVVILPCDDAYLSVSEESNAELAEKLKLRWAISEDGKTVSIKYRASSWFLGGGADKGLIVRIPRKLFGQLTSLDVNARGANVLMEGVEFDAMRVQMTKGSFEAKACVTDNISALSEGGSLRWSSENCPKIADFSTQMGDVSLAFSNETTFSLAWNTERGALASDFALTEQEGGKYLLGEAENQLSVTTKSGDLEIAKTEK